MVVIVKNVVVVIVDGEYNSKLRNRFVDGVSFNCKNILLRYCFIFVSVRV